MKTKQSCLYVVREIFEDAFLGVFAYVLFLGASIFVDNYSINHPQRHPCVAEVTLFRRGAYDSFRKTMSEKDARSLVEETVSPLEQACLDLEGINREMQEALRSDVSVPSALPSAVSSSVTYQP